MHWKDIADVVRITKLLVVMVDFVVVHLIHYLGLYREYMGRVAYENVSGRPDGLPLFQQ